MNKIAEVKQLKDGSIRVRGISISAIWLWDWCLSNKGYIRVDDVHIRGFFSFMLLFPYEVNYKKNN